MRAARVSSGITQRAIADQNAAQNRAAELLQLLPRAAPIRPSGGSGRQSKKYRSGRFRDGDRADKTISHSPHSLTL